MPSDTMNTPAMAQSVSSQNSDILDNIHSFVTNEYVLFFLAVMGVLLCIYYGRKALPPKIITDKRQSRAAHDRATYVEKNSGTITINHGDDKK